INLQTSGPHWVGAASYLGEEITIYPYINETIISGGTAHEGGASQFCIIWMRTAFILKALRLKMTCCSLPSIPLRKAPQQKQCLI
ncbi:hypothetical protein MJN47_29315, partial [Salmonella enterica subsp. enterica serovar Lubbock]|nr:hypothetical protein [Salmonella enterica subsp. enterica serovar Lubbock]